MVYDLTGLKGGPVGRHTPCTAPAALGHHYRELIKCIGFQSRYRMEQRRGVCRLTKQATDKYINKDPSSSLHTLSHMTILKYRCWSYN